MTVLSSQENQTLTRRRGVVDISIREAPLHSDVSMERHMLEIIIVYMLAKNIGNKVAAKGHKRFGYQLMLVALWIGGEIAGVMRSRSSSSSWRAESRPRRDGLPLDALSLRLAGPPSALLSPSPSPTV